MALKRSEMVRKTPLARGTVPLRRTRLRQVSPKRAAQPKKSSRSRSAVPDAVRRKLAKRSKGLCEAGTHLCVGVAREAQHRITQKGGGRHGEAKVYHDRLSNLLHCCTPCHRHITKEPFLSYEAGWSCKEGSATTDEPVLMRGVLVLLDDNGGVFPFEPLAVAA